MKYHRLDGRKKALIRCEACGATLVAVKRKASAWDWVGLCLHLFAVAFLFATPELSSFWRVFLVLNTLGVAQSLRDADFFATK